MFKFYVVFTIFFLTTQVSSRVDLKHENKDSYSLEDEIREQLEELRTEMETQLFMGYGEIAAFIRRLYYVRLSLMQQTETAIQQGYDKFKELLATLKNLAQSAGQNVDVCFEESDKLDQLTPDSIDSLSECVDLHNTEILKISVAAEYRIDILRNEVHRLEFQIDMCRGDILCLTPLVTQIELTKTKITQTVKLELQSAEELVQQLQVLIEQCINGKREHFEAQANIIYNQIYDCVNTSHV